MDARTPPARGRKLSFWERWKEMLYLLAVIAASSTVLWHWPEIRDTALLVILGVGAFFDLLSILAYVAYFLYRRPYSGFLGIGMVCYFWAWLSYPTPVMLMPVDDTLWAFWLAKLADLGVLLCLSLALYIPVLFVDTREARRND